MAVRRRPKKHMYWHDAAKLLLEHGATPSEVAKALKVVFPHTVVTGRHVGAYKRRLITDNMLEKNLPKTISLQDAYGMVEGMVGDDDRFVYQCSVGSATRTLKCFEYKLTMEAVEPTSEIDIWIQNIQA